jgi:hypothetical protein
MDEHLYDAGQTGIAIQVPDNRLGQTDEKGVFLAVGP